MLIWLRTHIRFIKLNSITIATSENKPSQVVAVCERLHYGKIADIRIVIFEGDRETCMALLNHIMSLIDEASRHKLPAVIIDMVEIAENHNLFKN